MSFFTLQTPGQNQGANIPGGPGALGVGAAKGGVSIFDLFLAQLAQQKGETAQVESQPLSEDETPLQSDNPALEKKPELNIARLLADNPEIEENIETLSQTLNLDILAEIEATLALNQQAFDNSLKPLTDGLITSESVEAGSPRLINGLIVDDEAVQAKKNKILLNGIKDFFESLDSISQGGNESEGGFDLALLNLTPEQITDLKAKIAQRQSVDVTAADFDVTKDLPGQNLFGALIALVAPKKIVANADLTLESGVATAPAPTTPVQEIVAKLNALVIDKETQGFKPLAESFKRLPAQDFETALKDFVGTKKAATGQGVGEIVQASQGKAPAPTPSANVASALQNFSALQGFFPGITGNLFANTLSAQSAGDDFGLSAMSGTSAQGLASLVTQAQSAGRAHPAAQLVAAHIQKNAGQGGETNIRLQLDPPELGRVEVRMHFAKDKSMKAMLSVEKPETFAMLQRDVHVLEKALQDAGIESEGGISFELAQGEDFLGGGNERGGSHEQGGTGAGGEGLDESELIETTMTWFVDPESGHTRYDIWA